MEKSWHTFCPTEKSEEPKLKDFDRRITQFDKTNPVCQRLLTVPGVGVLTATIILAMVGDPFRFENGRQFAAYIGLVPGQHSSGGKNVLLGISKRGNTYLCTLLIHGGRAVIRSVQNCGGPLKKSRSTGAFREPIAFWH